MANEMTIKILCCSLIIFMSALPVLVLAVNDSDNSMDLSNTLYDLETSFTENTSA